MNYTSVKNTAKDGRLIRAEIRELILALGFFWGFNHNIENAKKLYPDREDRQKQYTEIPFRNIVNNHLEKNRDIQTLPNWIGETAKYYFKYLSSNDNILFYDTKKFRIYRQRLEYEKERKWRLRKNTMQYFWTSAPLTLWYSYIRNENTHKLDFSNFAFITRAYNLKENMKAIQDYISNICNIDSTYDISSSSACLAFDDTNWKKLENVVEQEALILKQKFYNGCYINLKEEELTNLEKEYDYGKKTRIHLEAIARREKEKNSRPTRQS